MVTANVITPPALRANPVADQMFDAVFERSSDFHIKIDFDTAIGFLQRIGSWNEFEPAVVIEELENIDRRIPRAFYGDGSPHNGERAYTISVGRNGSPFILLERYEFDSSAASRLSDSDMRVICEIMEFIAKADEAHVEVHELSPGLSGRKITFRFWWD